MSIDYRQYAAFLAILPTTFGADLARWIRRSRLSSRRAIRGHLEQEFTNADPWRLDSDSFESARYEAMLDLLRPGQPYASGLEVGCAAGAFTERLAPLCRELLVIDLLPEAIERASSRLQGRTNITWRVADIATFTSQNPLDFIVVSEVLYYLGGGQALTRAIRNLVQLLAPGGVLIFASARDETCARWGLRGGAETCMRELSRALRETARIDHRGASPDQDCVIARYSRS